MFIRRTGKQKCFECKGIGKVAEKVCQRCAGYGSVTLRKLEQTRRAANEGRAAKR